jgi:hypothetical protein
MTDPNHPSGDAGSESTESDAGGEVGRVAADLQAPLLDVVWRQWRALGAAAARGAAENGQLRTIVDPEALVLVSLLLVEAERRLPDLLHDWIVRNSDLLSVQRMRNLQSYYGEALQEVLMPRIAWLAGIAQHEGKDVRWRPLATAASSSEPFEETLRTSGPPPTSSTRSTKKARATRVRSTSSATLLLRLRLGFSVGVKADLLAYLLSHAGSWMTVREVTKATGYTAAAVRRAADDLAAARFVELNESQPTGYRVVQETWSSLLALEELPHWGSWQERFVFSATFLQWANAMHDRPLSWYAYGANGRELLEGHRPAFERDLIAVWSSHSSIENWPAFVSRSVRSLASWMNEMA